MQIRDMSAFDLWLQDMLATTFDGALHEPVPEELLEIVRTTSDQA